MRLKSVVWVKAYIRRCAVGGAAAFVVRHGDDDAGAVYIKVSRLNGQAVLYGPAPMSLDGADEDRRWSVHIGAEPRPEQEIDSYLAQQFSFDQDIWVIEVEDLEGRHFLEHVVA